MAYESHAYLPAKWRIDGGGADITIKVLNDKGVEKVTEYVKKMAGNNALPERYAGFGDWESEFSILVDGAALPSDAAGGLFRAGAKGTFRFPVATTAGVAVKWFHVHVMCLEVSYDVPNDEMLQATIKVALDASANAQGQSSPFVYPS